VLSGSRAVILAVLLRSGSGTSKVSSPAMPTSPYRRAGEPLPAGFGFAHIGGSADGRLPKSTPRPVRECRQLGAPSSRCSRSGRRGSPRVRCTECLAHDVRPTERGRQRWVCPSFPLPPTVDHVRDRLCWVHQLDLCRFGQADASWARSCHWTSAWAPPSRPESDQADRAELGALGC